MTVRGVVAPAPASTLSVLVNTIARQRELSLLAVMTVLVAFVALRAPQFLTVSNLTQVVVLASIIAIAAVGQALVVITRNVDLSIESTIGLVAFAVADLLKLHLLPVPAAMVAGIVLGLVLGIVNGTIVSAFRVPAIVATLGTLGIYRGVDYLIAGGKEVSLSELPVGYTSAASTSILGIPLFTLIAIIVVAVAAWGLRQTRFGRQVYAVGSNPEAATMLGIPVRFVVFVVFAICGALGGVAGVLWGIEFGTINATTANGAVLAIIAAVVVGGVNIFGGSGTVVGAALGALFLGLVANALILLDLSQFWLQAVYGVVILIAVAADAVLLRRAQRVVAKR
jgi:rhamnose transport system permease protein